MPTVPKLEQSVQQQAPGQAELQAPSVVPGAFGSDVAASIEKAGDAGVKLGTTIENHIYQQNLWKSEAQAYDSAEKFRQNLQDNMYSIEPTTMKDSLGQEHDVPTGKLNRIGNQAQGITQQFDAETLPIQQSYLSQFRNNPQAQKMAIRLFDNIRATARNEVIQHEAKQQRVGIENTFLSSVVNQVNSSATLNNPADLSAGVDGVKASYAKLAAYKGLDPETSLKNTNEWAAKAVDKSVTNTLSQTGDLAQAQELLESVKDKINLDDYDKLNTKLEKGAESIQRIATRANDLRQNKNALDMLSGLTSGKLDWKNINDIEGSDVPEEFKSAVKSAMQADLPGQVNPKKVGYVEPKDKAMVNHLADVLGSDDQNQIVKTMAAALNNFGHGKISQNNLNVLTKLAIMRAKSLPCKEDLEAGDTVHSTQIPVDAGVHSLMKWSNQIGTNDPHIYGNYLDNLNRGDSVEAAVQRAQLQHALTKNPSIVNIPPNGKVLTDRFGNKATVYPDGRFEEIGAPAQSSDAGPDANKQDKPKADKEKK